MKRLNMLLLLASLSTVMLAQEVTVDAAKGRALDFLSRQSVGPKHAKGTLSSTDLSLAYTSSSEGKTCFYVFNVGDGDGFVIAGGDEAAQQILGYSSQGSFDYDTAPDNLRWWLSQYTEQIAQAEAPSQEALASTAAYRAKATQTRTTVAPLLASKWDQNEPFNSEIPVYESNDVHYVTGCAATAMAQVMYYHRWPERYGSGSYSYQNNGNTFSADFGATIYEWSKMKDDYSNGYNDDQAKAVGTLMYHAGVSVRMEYGVSASGTSSANIGPALARYFGYDKSIRTESRDYFTNDAWEELVYNELAANRPVLYSGQSSGGGGHAFVCDGYNASTGLFHINWGWAGYCDSYFTLTGDDALKPSGAGIGGSANSSYDQDQEITINVMSDHGNEATPHIVVPDYSNSRNPMYMTVNGETYEDNYLYDKSMGAQTLRFKSFVMNASCVFNHSDYFPETANVKIKVGVKVVDSRYGFVQYFCTNPAFLLTKIASYNSSTSRTTDINLSQFEYNGTYELRPVFCIDGTDDWQEMQVPVFETIPTVTITGGKNHDSQYVNFSISSPKVMVGETVQINHDSNYQGAITYTSNDPTIATVDAQGVVTGVSAGTATITVTGTADPERLYLETTATFNVQVIPFVKSVLHFTVDKANIYIGGQAQIAWPEDYDGEVSFTSSDPTIATVDAQGTISGVAKGEVTITAHAAESPHYFECDATFTIKVVELKMTFVEPPHFNNDNNTYRDDMVLYFKLRNDCDVPQDVEITAKLKIGGGTASPGIIWRNVYPGVVVTGSIDYADFLKYLESYNIKPVANTKYTVELLMGNGERFEDYPFVEFIYRNKLDNYQYYVSPAYYGTLVLPFNADLPEDLKAYSCSGVDNDVLILQEESSIRRNVPYIVKGTPGHPYYFTGPEAIDSDYQIARVNDYDILVGALGNNVPLEIGTDYIMQVHDDGKAAFYRYMGAPANPIATQFRAFLRFPETTAPSSQAPKINFPGNGDDETEGISTLSTDTLPAGIYTLDGHRQSTLQKGLNILILDDGTAQKVFVK